MERRQREILGMREIGEREELGKNVERQLAWCPQIWGTSLAGPTVSSLTSSFSPGQGIPRKGKREEAEAGAGERTAKAPAAPNEFKPLGSVHIPGT